jgi:hypothetical protein
MAGESTLEVRREIRALASAVPAEDWTMAEAQSVRDALRVIVESRAQQHQVIYLATRSR